MATRFGLGRAGAFHETNHGELIELSENNSVAERAGHWDGGGIVFTEQPIALDMLYKVELLERESKWSGGLVSVELVGH